MPQIQGAFVGLESGGCRQSLPTIEQESVDGALRFTVTDVGHGCPTVWCAHCFSGCALVMSVLI